MQATKPIFFLAITQTMRAEGKEHQRLSNATSDGNTEAKVYSPLISEKARLTLPGPFHP